MMSMLKLLVGVVLLELASGGHAASATRTASFEYWPGSGILKKEVIEPDSSELCLVIASGYDAFGNKNMTETRNCNGSTGEAVAPSGDALITTRYTSTVFDAQGRFATSATNALGHGETRVFDTRFGTVTSLTGPNALTTTWSYDAFGRKTLETRSDGNKTQFGYLYCSGVAGGSAACPTNGAYVVVTTPQNAAGTVNGAVGKTYYDALKREIRAETEGFDGTLVYKDTEYDSLGRVYRVSKPYYSGSTVLWTTFTYDTLGRVIEELQPATGAGTVKTATAYNGLSVTVTVSNNGAGTNLPEGVTQTKTTTKNSQGQTVAVTDTQGNTITYTYDPFGNLLTTNAGGVVTSLTYDLRGRKRTMADPDMGSWSYEYDALGQLKRQTDAKNQVTAMSYDVLGRMVNRSAPDLTSTWTFDWCTKGVGKLCETYSDNGYSRYPGYDAQGRLASVYTWIDTYYIVSYGYDANGRLAQTTYPENTVWPADVIVKNLYNARGYLASVTNAAGTLTYWQANTVSASGKVLTETLGNGATTTRAYDALDRMTGNVVANGGTNLQNFTYAYDAIGNLSQRVDLVQSSLTENFAYDRLNRLLQSSGTGLTTTSYNYDPLGNLTYKSDAGTYAYPAASAARPHAVSSISGTVNGFVNPAFTYDANGNLTTGLGRTLTYTSFNMPASVTGVAYSGGPSYSYAYTYNAEHERTRLIHSTLGTFIYLHPAGRGQLLYEKEVKPGGLIEHKNYINAGALLVGVIVNKSDASPTETRYFHHDRLGSLTTITNSAGAVLERLAYDAFGKRRYPNGTSDPNNSLFGVTTDRGFTGHEHLDEVALIHMNGRIYDPALARFVTADPTLQTPDNLQDYNRYSYVNNNPLAYGDPSGYFKIGPIKFKLSSEVRTIVGIGVGIWLGFGDFSWLWGQSALGVPGIFGPGFGTAYTAGFWGTAIATGGDYSAALRGGITAGLFNLAGSNISDPFGRVLAHSAIGCVSSASGGGQCGSGALSAGVAKFATGELDNYKQLGDIGRGIAVSVIGGTTSVIGGGKFDNGAVTAAFGYLFNYLTHSGRAGEMIKGLRSQSASFDSAITELERSPIHFHIAVEPGSGEIGATYPDRMIAPKRVDILIDPTLSSTVNLTDVAGNKFSPPTGRILTHEVGHALEINRTGPLIHRFFTYDRAVDFENRSWRQIFPGAPIRSYREH